MLDSNWDEDPDTWLSEYVEKNGVSRLEALFFPPIIVLVVSGLGLLFFEGILYVLRLINPEHDWQAEIFIRLLFIVPVFIIGWLVKSLASVAATQNDINVHIMQFSFLASVLFMGYIFFTYVF